MSKYYCTFWYPTIFLAEAKIREDKKQIRQCIDDYSPHPFEVILDIDDDENITIQTIITEKKEGQEDVCVKFRLFLKKIAKRSNGFIQYEFDFELSENDCDNLKKLTEFTDCDDPINEFRKHLERALSKPIYHYIKEFYHKHETVITDKDCGLVAICFEEEKDYVPLDNTNNCNDNKYLQQFLDCFTDNFKEKAYQASDFNFLLQAVISKFTDKYGTKIDKFGNNDETKLLFTKDFRNVPDDEFDLLIRYSQELEAICEDTLIEYVYCKTLLCSIYNKYYRHDTEAKLEQRDDEISKIEGKIEELRQLQQDVEILEQTKKQKTDELEKLKKLRRKALNIRNVVRYIENIKYKNQNRQNLISRTLLAKVQETNNNIQVQTISINSVLTNVQATNTSIQKQTTSINNVLKKSGKLNNISLVIAVFGILLTVISAFQDKLKSIALCNSNWFNLYIMLSIIAVILFIIALMFFSFGNKSNES